MKKQIITASLVLFLASVGWTTPHQNEKPKATETKKSEASCDTYTEFKKKQKAAKEQKAKEASKQAAKK